MLCYWILKRPDGTPAGLVRVQNGRVLLKPSASIAGRFTLFSDASAVPILPDVETVLPGAKAVLGTEGDLVTCFAAAPDAAPLADYRRRLSQNYTIETRATEMGPMQAEEASNISQNSTMEAEQTAESMKEVEDISRNNTMKAQNSVTDTARETEEFSLLLRRAEDFFADYEGTAVSFADSMVQKKDKETEPETGGIALFSQEFPGARWRYVDGTDVLPHYEGTWRQPNGQTMHILAVRGRAAPRPPRALLGFTRFLRDGEGNGYWLRLTPLP